VTSAGWGASIEQSIAFAWLPRELDEGTEISVRYFDRTLHGRVAATALFDPTGSRLRA
jgi:4-methylaminobutanoate oxidase (formaldehyde-forming)